MIVSLRKYIGHVSYFLFGGVRALPPGQAFTTTSVSLCIPNPGAESFGSWRSFCESAEIILYKKGDWKSTNE
jgi:hypothetical protein